jgi:hypothetical protein
MQKIKLTSFLVVLGFVLVSCQAASPNNASVSDTGNSPTASPTQAVDFIFPADPLNVTVVLDDKVATSKKISADGGSLSLKTKDGTVFTLDIPAEALDSETNITMTSVKSIEGAPLDKGSALAVQLEPSGLFFNKMVTLTILPGKEIPVKNQIIFGYEGSGQDYHLAVVDPKSKDIQVKLMQFSGAGVGSGSDSAWAANLQIQANGSRERLEQKLGTLTQIEHQNELLGSASGNDSPEWYKDFGSDLGQYVDQVVLKEMASAELDCQFARKAIHDLFVVENAYEMAGGTDYFVTDFLGKIDHLKKIGEECSKAYTVSGESNQVSFNGLICGLDKPFVIDATFPGGGSAKTNFKPKDPVSGETIVTGGGGDCTQTGGGSYTVTINQDGNGTIQWTTTDTLTCPNIKQTRSGTFSLPLMLAPDATCK